MDMFLGTVIAVAFPFVPRGFMTCSGQLLSISQNSALFALLGTSYGGDGNTTFALPDMRGRVAVGPSAGATGRIDAAVGSVGGAPNSTATLNGQGTAAITLTVANLPAHNHAATFTAGGGGSASVTLKASTDVATTSRAAANSFLATGKAEGLNQPMMYRADAGVGTVDLNPGSITVGGDFAGGSVAVANTGSGATLQAPVSISVNGAVPTTPPFIGLNYIICVEGIFPSRD